jgi:hypothetical protein
LVSWVSLRIRLKEEGAKERLIHSLGDDSEVRKRDFGQEGRTCEEGRTSLGEEFSWRRGAALRRRDAAKERVH